MAFPVRDAELVGKRVYESYSPAKAGVITAVSLPVGSPKHRPDGTTYPRIFAVVQVRWLKGETTTVETSRLNDFDALIADHEQKLKTHRSTLAKLVKLATEVKPWQAKVWWTSGGVKRVELFGSQEELGVAIQQAGSKMEFLKRKRGRISPHAVILKDGLLHQILA